MKQYNLFQILNNSKFIFLLICLLLILLLSLLYFPNTNETMYENMDNNDGIIRICGQNDVSKTCYDISLNSPYNDNGKIYPANSSVKAEINKNYYITSRGYINKIPYGYKVNDDMKTLTSIPMINISYDKPNNSTETTHMDDNLAIKTKYDTNNYDMQYHDEIDINSQSITGKTMVRDKNGKMVLMTGPIKMVGPTFYTPGTFKYGPKTYIPNYEDTIILSQYSGK